ncbi:hypothetical protein [Cellulophaga sp. Z1A5H]|uniref:hypothetical protein n=1 Tax=Cellulophaga sp. Z1A5H TaxID=2687291 RepID=UPI0013FD88C9|nr:hypothetical protein [Cellulophaga sp. Z1A5H]
MKTIFSTLITLLLLASCTTEKKPKVVYTDQEAKTLVKDTSMVIVADLPILIDSTNFLMHPIGALQLYAKDRKIASASWSYASGTNFNIASYDNHKVYGNLTNIKFEEIGTNKLVALTDKDIRITSADFLWDLYERTGKQLFIYDVIDADTNADRTLDDKDIKTLYISKIDGSSFKRLMPKNHELLEWKIIPEIDRLYVKSIEDTNKNGSFDKNDKLHYNYINLVDDALEVIDYYPY